ncbi:MAG: FAD-binding protein [Caldilineales bacterium]|nr:FAD-binding protein [Caldilineales bacterium]
MTDRKTLISALREIIPPERVLADDVQLLAYESDALTALRQRPWAVVLPETQDEAVEIVRCCNRLGTPFVARGSGTSLSGGATPVAEGVVIALNRLNRILHIDPEQRYAVVECGVANLAISQAVERFGLYFAPDPSSQPICTIGGNVAFNSGGAHCLKYGMTSNHILGLKVVLADGEVVEIGGESVEGVGVGPDLIGLFVGCEGLFGIALQMTVRLLPKPERFRTVLAAYHDLATAGQAVAQVVASGLLPGAMEIMDRLALKAAEAAVETGYPQGAEAVLIVELDGEADQVEREFMDLQKVIEASGAYAVQVAQGPSDRAKIWKGRKGAFSSVGRLSPDYVVQDGVVPRGRLGEALAVIGQLGKEYGLEVANVFHAGDGNLHPLILYDGARPGEYERAEEMAGKIIDLCIELGGSITGEHGVGIEKREHMPVMFSQVDLDVMKDLHRAFDPAQIANRGKMFPTPIAAGGRR